MSENQQPQQPQVSPMTVYGSRLMVGLDLNGINYLGIRVNKSEGEADIDAENVAVYHGFKDGKVLVIELLADRTVYVDNKYIGKLQVGGNADEGQRE